MAFEGTVVRGGAAGPAGNRIRGRYEFEARDRVTRLRFVHEVNSSVNPIAALPLLPIVIPLALWGLKKSTTGALKRLKAFMDYLTGDSKVRELKFWLGE